MSFDDQRMFLGRAVAALRVERGLKRRELAESAHVSYPYLSEIENGAKAPSSQTMAKLARSLQVSPADLWTRAEEIARQDSGAPDEARARHVRPAPPGPAASGAMVASGESRTFFRSPDGWRRRPAMADSRDAEDAIVARLVTSVRAEIQRWLDAELEAYVRNAVRAEMDDRQ
jgi:transcriptional regulator with XRE-family HTH domain